MCFKWREDTANKSFISLEQYKGFISQLRELTEENFTVNFTGGETLLFNGILELINFSVKKGFRTHIASNGWLIDEDMAKRIVGSGLNAITLSLDSLNEETHDYLRGVKGVYRRVMNAIDHLDKYNKDMVVSIGCAIYDWNLDGLMPLTEWVLNNDKLRSISFIAPMQPNSTDTKNNWWEGEYGYLWPKDTKKACLFIDEIIKLKSVNSKIGNMIAQLEAFKFYFMHPDKFVKKTKCNLDRSIHVNAFGEIWLCSQWGILGSIGNGDNIKYLWDSEKAALIRKQMAVCKKNCHFLVNCFPEEQLN